MGGTAGFSIGTYLLLYWPIALELRQGLKRKAEPNVLCFFDGSIFHVLKREFRFVSTHINSMHLPRFPLIQTVGTSLLTLLVIGHVESTVTDRVAKAELPNSGSLTVEVTGLENQDGQVCFNIFESSEGFPDDPEAVVAEQCISAANEPSDDSEAASSPLAVTFSDLSMGTYAVSVLHDENSDEQINQGTFGIPTEGFGFSRNPVVQTGAPEFYEVAVFVVGETTTQIEMIYF